MPIALSSLLSNIAKPKNCAQNNIWESSNSWRSLEWHGKPYIFDKKCCIFGLFYSLSLSAFGYPKTMLMVKMSKGLCYTSINSHKWFKWPNVQLKWKARWRSHYCSTTVDICLSSLSIRLFSQCVWSFSGFSLLCRSWPTGCLASRLPDTPANWGGSICELKALLQPQGLRYREWYCASHQNFSCNHCQVQITS